MENKNLTEEIYQNIDEKIKLLPKDKKLVRDILCEHMNLERCDFIIDQILDMRLDKSSVIAFLTYQLYKVEPERAESFLPRLTNDEKTMFETYKQIRDINDLTLSENAEDIKNMFLALSKDIRVVVIKLFGILYDISILSNPLSAQQKKFVSQVEDIHVPLAERLGFDRLKLNLEDNVIRLTHPDEYNRLNHELRIKKEENERQLELTKYRVENILKDLGIKGEINYRQKHISSIYRKLHSKNLRLNQIYDLMAMRVIVDSVEECYAVLGRIHAIYRPMPGRVKDYIANPKPNGYKSLHTTIIVENQHPMEVQIRTHQMHKESEFGVYAHWLYKEKKTTKNALDRKITWFREMLENAKVLSDEEFVKTLKADLYDGLIFVQTPKGRVIELPEGATAIDFAYAIHSDIGNSCVGVKVNSKIKPITTTLANGDIVEILTNPHSKGPSRDWLNYAKTSSARSKIKSFFKKELKEDNIKLGKSMMGQAMQEKDFTSGQLLTDKYIAIVLEKLSMKDLDELYAAVGSGSMGAGQAVGRFISLWQKDNEIKTLPNSVVNVKKNKEGVLIDGDSGMLVRYAGCCNPIEGDEIIGYISRGKGVTIHRKNCPNIKYLEPERLISANWQEQDNGDYFVTLKVVLDKQDDAIVKLTSAISSMKIALKGFEAKDNGDTYLCSLGISVKNTNEVNKIINSLKNINNVFEVARSERW